MQEVRWGGRGSGQTERPSMVCRTGGVDARVDYGSPVVHWGDPLSQFRRDAPRSRIGANKAMHVRTNRSSYTAIWSSGETTGRWRSPNSTSYESTRVLLEEARLLARNLAYRRRARLEVIPGAGTRRDRTTYRGAAKQATRVKERSQPTRP